MNARPKILIVDDNKINLVVLKKVLEQVDAELIEANDGMEALAASRDHDFALAILDVQMPNMDGYELAEHFRADEKTRNVPIIFVTAAYDDDFHMFRSYEAGGVDYLMKPYQPEVLLAKVRVFLELDRDRRELQLHRDRLEDIVSDRVRDIDHLNKRLRLINELDQLMVRAKSSVRLVQSACKIIAKSDDFSKAWIILNQETDEPAEGYQSGVDPDEFRQLQERFKRGSCPACGALSLKHQDVVVINANSPLCSNCAIRSCQSDNAMISPLSHQDQQFGWIFVSIDAEKKPDQTMVALFRQIANDLAFALSSIAVEQERNQAATRLKQSNQQLMMRNEEIQYFYHSLAHELKTPLTAAREFLSFVLEEMVGPLNDLQREYLEVAQDNCSNLTIYINDLLDMTRLDTGKLSLDPEPVKIRKLVRQVISVMKSEAARKDITLASELEEGIDEIEIDKSRITQVLLNLLTNAVKFTPQDGRVTVSLYGIAGRPDWVGISVKDNGCGIPEEQLPYIFRRYFQVDTSNHEQKEGFGLGLYLSSEIVKLHGGEISVESSPENGSVFQVLLPVKQSLNQRSKEKRQKSYVFSAGR